MTKPILILDDDVHFRSLIAGDIYNQQTLFPIFFFFVGLEILKNSSKNLFRRFCLSREAYLFAVLARSKSPPRFSTNANISLAAFMSGST